MTEKLRDGITTGATAAACMKAALLAMKGQIVSKVSVLSPIRVSLTVPIVEAHAEGNTAWAKALKDAGDDLDCTNGTEIVVKVEKTNTPGLVFKAGKGVGTVTRPGLQEAVGSPAINPGPKIMMRYVYDDFIDSSHGLIVTVSVPKGEELAKQTLNPTLGVVGGISILGTTGVVKPMSEDAYKRSLAVQIPVVKAAGFDICVLCPGRIGRSASQKLGIPEKAVAETSNFIGYMMEQAVGAGFKKILLIGHMGKLVKVASGSFHTYNRNSDGRMETLAAYAALNGASPNIVKEILDSSTTDGAYEIIKRENLTSLYHQLAERAQVRSERYIFQKAKVGIIIVLMDGSVLAKSTNADAFLKEEQWNIK